MTPQRRNELIAQIQKLSLVQVWSKNEKDQICELFESLIMEMPVKKLGQRAEQQPSKLQVMGSTPIPSAKEQDS